MAISEPTTTTERVTNLDSVRGIAVLGILLMNGVSYGLGTASYFNLDSEGTDTVLDWIIGVFGEVFVDQKFMALFSMLFGAGIVLFADRASAKGRRPVGLSLWRNLLLLFIGVAHSLLWDGDVLVVYAIAAPLLVLVRGWSPRVLAVLGTATVMLSPVASWLAQRTVDDAGGGLGEYWFSSGPISDAVGLFLLTDFFSRAIGMMLIGVALYRVGFLSGRLAPSIYRRTAIVGLSSGLALASLGLLVLAVNDFSPDMALIGTIPNTIGTIPAALGYAAMIALWNTKAALASAGSLTAALHRRLQAVGRMALTNYLSQTVLGVLVLRVILGDVNLTRTSVLAFIVAVWAVQLAWSAPWLERFRWGPAEWLWRSATYRRLQPLMRG